MVYLGTADDYHAPRSTCVPPCVCCCLQVGREAMSMREAMKALKDQALSISVAAQRDAAAAAAERAAVEAQLEAVTKQLVVGARVRVHGTCWWWVKDRGLGRWRCNLPLWQQQLGVVTYRSAAVVVRGHCINMRSDPC